MFSFVMEVGELDFRQHLNFWLSQSWRGMSYTRARGSQDLAKRKSVME